MSNEKKAFNSSLIPHHSSLINVFPIVTLPNILTVIRMVLIPVFVSTPLLPEVRVGLGRLRRRGVTDGLDGLLARRFDQKSHSAHPRPDCRQTSARHVFSSSFHSRRLFRTPPRATADPFWVTAAVISRDVFIIVGAAVITW